MICSECLFCCVWGWDNRVWVAEVSHTNVACLHAWDLPPQKKKKKQPEYPGSHGWASLVGNSLQVLTYIIAESIKQSLWLHWEWTMEAWPGFFWTLSHVPFPFVNFNLYTFTIINDIHEYNIFLWVLLVNHLGWVRF